LRGQIVLKRILYAIIIFVISFQSLFLNPITSYAEKNESIRIVVKYKSGKQKEKKLQFKEVDKIKNAVVIEIPEKEVLKVKDVLEKDPTVEYVEEEIEYTYFGTVNDPYFHSFQRGDFEYINATKAWDLLKPQYRPTVAIVDSGIDPKHVDLKEQIVKPYNVINSATSPYDDVGHGTHVAGIVGAKTNNQIGIASVSKGTYIMPIKVGDRNSLTNIDVAIGIYYAVDHGADIINLSIGGPYSQVVEDAVNYAYEQGVLVIAAAGNEGCDNETYPAAFRSVLGVAAVDSFKDSIAPFSNYGSWVSIAAPGVNIYSTYPTNRYAYMAGTSMATPMVASVAALLKSHEPILTNQQLRWILEQTSKSYNGSEKHENGRVDAYEALDLIDEYARVYGPTSVETSNKIVDVNWEKIPFKTLKPNEVGKNPYSKTKNGSFAILASNQSFPDSLAATALAYKLDAPILLTFPNKLRESTVNVLQAHGVTDVIILGGTSAVSQNVEQELRTKGFEVLRISGKDRFQTAAYINDYVATTGGTVIIANGRKFPDALAISSYSAKEQIPIVFVETNRIPKDTQAFLDKYKFSRAIIVGGDKVVTNQIKNLLPNPIRLSGSDRYETNIRILDYFERNSSIGGYLFATGVNFPDALSGGVLSAKLNFPLLLVDKSKLPFAIKKYLKTKRPQNIPIGILGGPAAVSTKTVWELDALIYQQYYDQKYSPTQINMNKQEKSIFPYKPIS
jgi:thermitase